MGLTIDFSDFRKKFQAIAEKAIPEAAEQGMGRAGIQLLLDCLFIPPTVPLKEGWLRGSGSVFVQGKLVASGVDGKPGNARTESPEPAQPGEITALVSFSTPYAHRLHEGVGYKFTDPSSGPKYLESKLVTRRKLYYKIIADTIKEGEK